MLRHIVVAETDEEARRIAKPAMDHHAGSLHWLRKKHAADQLAGRLNMPHGETFEDWTKAKMIITGTPETVAAEIQSQIEETGINYLLTYLFFGTMALSDAMRSLALFSEEVMPKLGA